jgi:hypothetical protein
VQRLIQQRVERRAALVAVEEEVRVLRDAEGRLLQPEVLEV